MTEGEIGTLVDKLADKLGVAVDKVMPVAKDALDQFIGREIFYSITFACLAVVLCILSVFLGYLCRYGNRKCYDGYEVAGGVGCAVSGIFALALFGGAISHVGKAIAPLAALLGM